jgi:glutamate-ammonia-ligase adenylyltransferase
MGHVHSHFDLLIAAPQLEQSKEQDTGLATVWSSELDQDEAIAILEARGYTEDAKQVLGLLAAFHNGSAYKTFTSQGQERFDRLMPQLLAAAGLGNYPEKTLARLLNVMEAIGRRSAYLALLIENPLALSQLVKLCSASPWIAEWISLHPLLLDELLNPVSVAAMPGKNELAADLAQLLNQYDRDDLERLMEVLREFCNRHVLHLAAAEVGPGIAANVLGRQLSNIADVLIGASLDLAIEAMTQKHGTPQCASGTPGFVVVGYGKLGGHELGFGSDVDIIFLHNNCTEGETDGKRSIANETYFARVTQRLIHILSTRTFGGILYEVDARLRPSGKSGPIVTSLDAFLKYQQERAWTWEYQALVRARPVAGDSELAGHFMEARQQILCQKREPQTLKKDVREMRAKMLASQKPHAAEEFDVKHDRGGIVDVEFMVQYWVLVWAHDHPGLTQHTENCAILRALAEAGLIEPALAQVLLDAYQGYLSTAYHLKLMHAGTRIKRAAGDALGDYPDKVLKIWQDVMEQDT